MILLEDYFFYTYWQTPSSLVSNSMPNPGGRFALANGVFNHKIPLS